MIHYSTDYVFDGRKADAYREGDATAPVNVYGRTKLEGERSVMAAGAAHLIFRTSWVYGPRGRNFLLTMLKLGRERKELKIVDDQHGAPTSARLIAEATAGAVARILVRRKTDIDRLREIGGLFNMTAAGRTTWYGFAQAILTGRKGVAKCCRFRHQLIRRRRGGRRIRCSITADWKSNSGSACPIGKWVCNCAWKNSVDWVIK